jgi:hypothetical protein
MDVPILLTLGAGLAGAGFSFSGAIDAARNNDPGGMLLGMGGALLAAGGLGVGVGIAVSPGLSAAEFADVTRMIAGGGILASMATMKPAKRC